MATNINFKILNELEQTIHKQLSAALLDDNLLSITNAAKLCDVSPSKISKFCKKLGFENYKQYKIYITTGKLIPFNNKSEELQRLEKYIKTFNPNTSTKLAKLIHKSNRIILCGMGPSLIAVEYFAYRLRIVTCCDVMTSNEDFFMKNHMTNNSLLIIFTATGLFQSYANIVNYCESNNFKYIIICEENNHIDEYANKNLLYLTNSTQVNKKLPYEKTRTIWFIYIEEVLTSLAQMGDAK